MDKKNYTWLFDLEEFTMTKDVLNDYTGTVRTTRSYTMTDIAKEIAAERTEYREKTLVNIGDLIDEKIRQLVCSGNTVITGSAIFSPSLLGVFLGNKGIVDPEVNKCVVNVSPSTEMRAEVAKVKPTFSGTVKSLGGARISLVLDTTTGKTDGTITPGGTLDVTGSKIRCLNADGTGIGNLTLVNIADESVAATITVLAMNDPSRLMFNVPATLAPGSYRLMLETWFSNNSTRLKQSRTLTYPITLVVKDDAEDDDRPVIE